MKDKLIISSVFASILAMSALFAFSSNAQAHEGLRGYRGGYYHGGCYGCGWVAPALIGGVIGYELNRPRYYEQPVIVQQQPVIVQQSPVYIQQPQSAPYGYHWQEMVDPQTGVRKIVAVPN
jgi:hypothetical protein